MELLGGAMRPQRILVVDDDPIIRQFLQTVFAWEGCDIDAASDVPAAIGLLDRDGRFDVVLTDYEMPGGSGFDVLEAAKGRAPQARRILMSGGLDDAARDRARGLAEEVLLKPLDRVTLVERVIKGPGGP